MPAKKTPATPRKNAPSPKPALTAKPWEHGKAGQGSQADALAARFVESLSYDQRLYEHDIRGSIAHARMLRQVGLITPEDLKAIERGLEEIRREIAAQGAAWPGWRLELEDVHMCLEAALIEKIGEPGRKLHTGRSRNDQVALDLHLWLKDAADQIAQRIRTVQGAFVDRASRQGQIVMPAYTHLQRAQPIVLGAELLAWAQALERARQRTAALVELNLDNPLGGGAVAGSSLPLDRAATTAALGLTGPTASAIEATATRDAALDFAYALAMTAMWLSRWAEQWIIYATTEFGFLKLDSRYTTGSSMMPQKQNPDMLELIRGRCGNVYGNLLALLTICKGLPIGYNRDLQEDKRNLFAAYDTVSNCLDMAARIVATASFDEDRISAGLDSGFLDATSLAEYLVTRGAPFRTAHQIVGRLVGLCREQGKNALSELNLEVFNQVCQQAGLGGELCARDVYDWLGPRNVVKRYKTAGNAGLSGFQQQMQAWRARLKQES